MTLARIIGLSTEELSDGSFRVILSYNGVPSTEQLVSNTHPPNGIVHKQLEKRGYTPNSQNPCLVYSVDIQGIMNVDGKTATGIYTIKKEDEIMNELIKGVSEMASRISINPFSPNPSRNDPRSN